MQLISLSLKSLQPCAFNSAQRRSQPGLALCAPLRHGSRQARAAPMCAYGDRPDAQEFVASSPASRLSRNGGSRQARVEGSVAGTGLLETPPVIPVTRPSNERSTGAMLADRITATESRQGTVYFLAGAELEDCDSHDCDTSSPKLDQTPSHPSDSVSRMLQRLGASVEASGSGGVFILK